MVYLKLKRSLDLILSIIGLIILAPLLLIVAICIKLESRGPVIFKQDRIGQNGKVFKIYKFRSMCNDAEKYGVYELKGDSRVTMMGRIIRALSIDELPQMINIIKGDMSIIGPRPTLTYHPWPYEKYTDEQLKRFSVRPGLTGWAQVNGRKDVPWEKRIIYDIYYVNNLSFLLDTRIFFKTVKKVLSNKGNYNTSETVTKR